MAEFDSEVLLREQNRVAQLERDIQSLQTSFQQQSNEVTYLRNLAQHNVAQSIPTQKSLNLPPPPRFSGTPSEIYSFRLRLGQFMGTNNDIYTNSRDQILYAGSLLDGQAGEWYLSLVDPHTFHVPSFYTLDSFLQELEDFFGGAITLQSRERSLIILRQTGSVSELAIAFQTITNNFNPRWSDHPLIFVFSQKLKEVVRFELTSRGSVPDTFQAYLAAAISVEHNQAAAAQSRSQLPPPPRLPFIPKAILPPPPRQPSPNYTPMEVDGTRGVKGPLPHDERRRRYDGGLCAYCGQPGHVISTCPRKFQVRGVFPVPPQHSQSQAGYNPPPGYQLIPQTFPTPWTQVPSPHTTFNNPPAALPGILPKNGSPSQ